MERKLIKGIDKKFMESSIHGILKGQISDKNALEKLIKSKKLKIQIVYYGKLRYYEPAIIILWENRGHKYGLQFGETIYFVSYFDQDMCALTDIDTKTAIKTDPTLNDLKSYTDENKDIIKFLRLLHPKK